MTVPLPPEISHPSSLPPTRHSNALLVMKAKPSLALSPLAKFHYPMPVAGLQTYRPDKHVVK